MLNFIYITALLFLLMSIYIFLSYNQFVYYKDFGDKNSSIKICLLAGVHGNEPAASILFQKFIDNDKFEEIANEKNIFIRVIPSVNEFGLNFNTRYQNNLLYPDINRSFTENGALHHISKDIIRLTMNMTLVIDFHEGWGFHKIDRESLGSSLTITGDKNIYYLSRKIIQRLNDTIPKNEHKFDILHRICDIKNTLSCYFHLNNKNYILVETTGQNDIQPISIRQMQIINILDTVFAYF